MKQNTLLTNKNQSFDNAIIKDETYHAILIETKT